jgi:multiple sugar transport system permease protein
VARALKRTIAHVVLIAVSAAILLPLLWVVGVSLTSGVEPNDAAAPAAGNLVEVFRREDLGEWLVSSLVVAAGATVVAVPLAVMLGYALARGRDEGSGLRLALVLGAILPPVALALPLFAIFLTAGRLNSYLAIGTAHVALNLPLLAWLMTGAFGGRRRGLEEAARMEGASRLGAFWRVAVPLAAPGILGAGLLGFLLS